MTKNVPMCSNWRLKCATGLPIIPKEARPTSTFGCRVFKARNELDNNTLASFIDTPSALANQNLNAVDDFFLMELGVPDQHKFIFLFSYRTDGEMMVTPDIVCCD